MKTKDRVQDLFLKGYRQAKIALFLGISDQRVHQILHNYRTLDKIKKEKEGLYGDGFCQLCNKKTETEIHHIDGNCNNNEKGNLIIICKKCHSENHLSNFICEKCGKIGLKKTNGYAKFCKDCIKIIRKDREDKWAKNYDQCLECGLTSSKHKSRGLCTRCNNKNRYHNDKEYRERIDKNHKRWRKNNPEQVKEIARKASKKYNKKNNIKEDLTSE